MDWIEMKKELPEPYTTVLLHDGEECWFGHFDCACDQILYYFGNEEKDDKEFYHWAKITNPRSEP